MYERPAVAGLVRSDAVNSVEACILSFFPVTATDRAGRPIEACYDSFFRFSGHWLLLLFCQSIFVALMEIFKVKN